MSRLFAEHSMLTGNMMTIVAASPRTGFNSRRPSVPSPPSSRRLSAAFPATPASQRSLLSGQLSSDPLSSTSSPRRLLPPLSVPYAVAATRRVRASSLGNENVASINGGYKHLTSPGSPTGKKVMSVASAALAKARSRSAQKENDAMVYLDGPQIYTCAQCRTHLTSHDDIISKSFHGRRGELCAEPARLGSYLLASFLKLASRPVRVFSFLCPPFQIFSALRNILFDVFHIRSCLPV